MEKDDSSPDFDATKAELFEAISHPARIKILQALNDKPMGYAQLARSTGLESGGQLSFHLTKLRHLVKTTPEGNYALTADGKEALWSVNALRKATGDSPIRVGESSIRHRSWLKPTLGIILVTVIVLGGLIAYQQEEFGSQQQELASQQKLVALLQNGLPFTNGQSASLVIGQRNFDAHSAATSQSGLWAPTAVAFDSSGSLWVAEFLNMRILEFRPPFTDGMQASLVLGQENFTTSTPATTRNGFGVGCCGPNSVTFDANGNLWVADYGNNRVLEFVPPFKTGMNASLVIGQVDFYHNYMANPDHLQEPGGPASPNGLSSPQSTAFDSSGNLWVLDGGYNRVLEFVPPFTNGMNASLVLGQTNFTNDGPSGGLSGLNCKFGDFAIDRYNDVWVGDNYNNRIVEYKPPFRNGMNASFIITQQNVATNAAPSPYGQANLGSAIEFDPAGNLWVSSNDRFLVFKPPFTTGIRSFPSLEIGQPNFTSTVWSGGQNGFYSASGYPAFDASGNLWVPDGGGYPSGANNRVLEFAAYSSLQSPPASGPALVSIGQIQLVVVGAVVLTGGGLAVLLLRRRARGPSTTSSAQ